MNSKIWFVLALLMGSQAALAKPIEEVLKDKGVITPEEAAEATKDKPKVSYKPGDGFTFTTADEKAKLTLGGRLQVQYEDYQPDKDKGDPSARHDSFRIRRAYVWIKGYTLTKDLTYKLQVDFKDPAILDAWLNYRLMDEVQLELGQDVVPFARQEINSSASLQFVERSPTEIYYRPSYDTGAMVWGRIANGFVTYNVGLFNGVGQNQRRSTSDNAVNLRLVVAPLGDVPYAESDLDRTPNPQFAIGSSVYYNRLHTDGDGKVKDKNSLDYVSGFLGKGVAGAAGDRLDVLMAEADGVFRWNGLYAQTEYFWAQAKGAHSGSKLRSAGWYAQAGYLIVPQFELAARYSQYDPDISGDAKKDTRSEIAGAANYYLFKNVAKLQLEVASLYNEASKARDLRTRLQAQVMF